MMVKKSALKYVEVPNFVYLSRNYEPIFHPNNNHFYNFSIIPSIFGSIPKLEDFSKSINILAQQSIYNIMLDKKTELVVLTKKNNKNGEDCIDTILKMTFEVLIVEDIITRQKVILKPEIKNASATNFGIMIVYDINIDFNDFLVKLAELIKRPSYYEHS